MPQTGEPHHASVVVEFAEAARPWNLELHHGSRALVQLCFVKISALFGVPGRRRARLSARRHTCMRPARGAEGPAHDLRTTSGRKPATTRHLKWSSRIVACILYARASRLRRCGPGCLSDSLAFAVWRPIGQLAFSTRTHQSVLVARKGLLWPKIGGHRNIGNACEV